ncbi:MAG: GNAT family N-acetyltransferase [Dehalococcoidia bacterium]
MAVALTVRMASEADVPALAQLDASYSAGRRVLALDRTGAAPETTIAFRWRDGTAREAVYGVYDEARLRRALGSVDLCLVAEIEKKIAGLLMVLVPSWTDAGEITDLVVDRTLRERGAGRALVGGAVEWARGRSLRALWVEPRADNADAIECYLSLGFRLSGFNDRMYSNGDHEGGKPTLYFYLELAEA